MTKVPARAVYVDGHSIPTLAAGGWVALPPGKHLLTFVPPSGSGFRPNQGIWVTLAPGAYVSKNVPLPVISNTGAHMAQTPAAPSSPVTPAANPQVTPVSNVGWYAVTGWIAADASGPKATPVRATADWIKVDGQPIPALSLGQWAQLPAGKHSITFQPLPGLGVGPKTWDIDLTAQTHLNQNVPLPLASGPQTLLASQQFGWYAVSGWVPVSAPGRKPSLSRASAQWVKVDGQPITALAIGQWAQLSAGKHVVTFQPTPALHIAPKTWDIDLAPQAHFNQKIPFSSAR
ncbi:MAG: hypothetical protein M3Y13_05060 [Armatimonadota bacterium]|nr:hypothetical protein [Armatimonadota bacterium]